MLIRCKNSEIFPQLRCLLFDSRFLTRTSLPEVPVSAITQDLRATWASARSSGDRRRPTKCLLTWLLDSLESLGAPGTTLAYCRVKYSTFLISHSAPLYLRQNYADWYIRVPHRRLQRHGVFKAGCWRWLSMRWFPNCSSVHGLFFSVFCIEHNLIPQACLANKNWWLNQHRHYEVYLHTIWGSKLPKTFIVCLYCKLMKRVGECATWYAAKHRVCPPSPESRAKTKPSCLGERDELDM